MTRFVLSIFLLCVAAAPAKAQPQQKDWDVRVGAGAIHKPEYPGADDYEVIPLPYISIDYRDRVFLNPVQGLGAYAVNNQKYALGAAIGYDFGRDEDDSSRLRGMGDVDATAEAVLFGAIKMAPFEINGELRHDVLDGHGGTTIEAGVDYKRDWNRRTFLTIGPAVEWTSEDYMQSYFGVNAAQAAASQFNRFDAESGISKVSLGGNLTHRLNENWFVTGLADYAQLLQDTSDSPISDQDAQLFTGAFVGYQF